MGEGKSEKEENKNKAEQRKGSFYPHVVYACVDDNNISNNVWKLPLSHPWQPSPNILSRYNSKSRLFISPLLLPNSKQEVLPFIRPASIVNLGMIDGRRFRHLRRKALSLLLFMAESYEI